MVNIGYRASRLQGNIVRSIYGQILPLIVDRTIQPDRKISAVMYAFSCERDLLEQVASIRSFLKYVGVPKQFIVISDGTYTRASSWLLRSLHNCVDVIELKDLLIDSLPQSVSDYAAQHPLGKKLSALISIPVTQPTIYLDSDILFFPSAFKLAELAVANTAIPHCLSDCVVALDERLLKHPSEHREPINSGFIVLRKPLDWSPAIERLEELKAPPNYFTEQTIVHLTLHFNDVSLLPKNKFVVSLSDQCSYHDIHKKNEIFLRHYISPVRHKFWLNVLS